jgi:hypothetical protein
MVSLETYRFARAERTGKWFRSLLLRHRCRGCTANGSAELPAVLLESGSDRPVDIRSPACALEHPDELGRQVELATVDAMPGACRVGVVHVVPALPE